MAQIRDYQALCFDVYGTLIDWETGMLAALEPHFAKAGQSLPDRVKIVPVIDDLEYQQQSLTPAMRYRDVLAAIHPLILARFDLAPPTPEESAAFGASIGKWPAYPDTVDALTRLGKHYKLVVLSNTDKDAFAETNAGPLQGVPFDLVITAEEVGSYKPAARNFEYMVDKVQKQLGIGKDGIVQTAESQTHDHYPAEKMGIKSSWIVRPRPTMAKREKIVYDWKFDTLGLMADAVEAEQS